MEQPLHLLLFFLIQKQCTNLIHSNINTNYRLPGNIFKKNTCSKAEYGSRGNENEIKKHNKYYKLLKALHFFKFISPIFPDFWRI